MPTVTWLHISDLHWRESEAYEANVVAQALLRDLAKRVAIAPCLEHIDFIFVTGDVAFVSRPAEYALARRFLDDLRRTTGVRKDHLFVVPGNHDVDRDAISDEARDIVSRCARRSAANELLGHEVQRAIIMQRFHRYQEFVNLYFGEDLPFDSVRYFYVKRRRVASNRWVAILGLNSAWASASDTDRLNLFLGERQVQAALDQVRRVDIRIALIHHPFDWLRDFDRDTCEPLLLRKCDFVLHGHLHHTGLQRLQAPWSEAMVIGAGACYEMREYPNAYNLVHLDLNSRKGTVYLRMYSDQQGGFWTKDLLSYQDAPGEYIFDLPRQWITSLPVKLTDKTAGIVQERREVTAGTMETPYPPQWKQSADYVSVQVVDAYSDYETGLHQLRNRVKQDHPRYSEFLVYQQRLTENIGQSRRYGDTEARKAERSEIIDRLNELSLSMLDMPFTDLYGLSTSTTGRGPSERLPDYEGLGGDKWWKERGYSTNPFAWSNAADVGEDKVSELFHLWHVDPKTEADLEGLGPTPTLDKVKSPDTSRLVLIFAPGGGGKTFYCRWATRQVREGKQHALEIGDVGQHVRILENNVTARDLAACIHDHVCERFSIPKDISPHEHTRHILRKCNDALERLLSASQESTRMYIFIDDIDQLFDEQPSGANRNAQALTAMAELCRTIAKRRGGGPLALRIFIPQQLMTPLRNRLQELISGRRIAECAIFWTPAHCQAIVERRLDSCWQGGPNTGVNHLSRLLTQDARDEFLEWLQHLEDMSPGRVVEVLDRLAYYAYSNGVAANERICIDLWKEFSRSSECTDICTPDAPYPGV